MNKKQPKHKHYNHNAAVHQQITKPVIQIAAAERENLVFAKNAIAIVNK